MRKKVCSFLGADLVIEKDDGTERELNSLCNLLQKIIMNGTDFSWFDINGKEILNEHNRCNADD